MTWSSTEMIFGQVHHGRHGTPRSDGVSGLRNALLRWYVRSLRCPGKHARADGAAWPHGDGRRGSRDRTTTSAVGTMLLTLVDPHRGHEVAYNRWYERDHFYAGCMIGAGWFAGKRWVATRDLKDLRAGRRAAPTGVPARPRAGVVPGHLLGREGQDAEAIAWGSTQVHWLHDNDRMFDRARPRPHADVRAPLVGRAGRRRRAHRAGAGPPVGRAGRAHGRPGRRRPAPGVLGLAGRRGAPRRRWRPTARSPRSPGSRPSPCPRARRSPSPRTPATTGASCSWPSSTTAPRSAWPAVRALVDQPRRHRPGHGQLGPPRSAPPSPAPTATPTSSGSGAARPGHAALRAPAKPEVARRSLGRGCHRPIAPGPGRGSPARSGGRGPG